MMMLKPISNAIVVATSALVISLSLWTGQARAVDLSSGDVEASLDTTVSYGVAVRVQKQDKDLIAKINDNDGNLNYKRGIISNAVKLTSDLDIRYQNIGLFVRGTGFFDHENENGEREHTPLNDEAKALVGKDIDLLDAYVTANMDFDEVSVDVRFGKHVLNWGESTFIQNGINAVNPFDVSKLRVPGAELREALVAVPLVSTVMELPGQLLPGGILPARLGQDRDRSAGDLFLNHRLRRAREHDGRTSTIPISTRRWKAIPFPTRPCWGTIPSSWSSGGARTATRGTRDNGASRCATSPRV